MYVIAGKFRCEERNREALLELVAKITPPSRAEKGCISYSCYEDSLEPGAFLFFEEWQSREAIAVHFETAHFHAFMRGFGDLIEGTPDIKIYRVDSIEKL